MSNLVKTIPTYRSWWKYPRRAGERPPKRPVTFLELFFDLVFVVLIAKLTNGLMNSFSWANIGVMAGLYYLVWWAWYNGTSYFDLHGSNDMRTHIITFAMMGSILGMCTFAESVMTTGGMGFALNYAGFLIINAISWWRTGVHDPDHRTMAYPYSFALVVTVVIFLVSTLLPTEQMYRLWVIGGINTLLTPFYTFRHRNNEEHKRQVSLVSRGTYSMSERLGLLTIIMLGEVVNAIVYGATRTHFDHMVPINGILATLLVMSLFWGYFNLVNLKIPKHRIVCFYLWTFTHLILTISLGIMSAALPQLIKAHYEYVPRIVQTSFMLASFVAMLSTTLLGYNVEHKEEDQCYAYKTRRVMLYMCVVPLIGACFPMRSTYIIATVFVTALVPIIQAIILWSNRQMCPCSKLDK